MGGELLRLLLGDGYFTRIISIGRRALPIEHPKLVQEKVEFSNQAAFTSLDAPDVAFCCLGTTIKKAGSREAFRAVDYDAVLTFANAARAKGARVFLHVSSLGANRTIAPLLLFGEGRDRGRAREGRLRQPLRIETVDARRRPSGRDALWRAPCSRSRVGSVPCSASIDLPRVSRSRAR